MSSSTARALRVAARAFSCLAALTWLLVVPTEAAASDAGAPAGRISVLVEHGALSVDLEQVPLAEVLREIAEQARIEIRIRGDAGLVVSRAFRNLPLDRGIRRLVAEHGLVMHFNADAGLDPARRLRAVHVHAGSDGEASALLVTFLPPASPDTLGVPADRDVSERRARLLEVSAIVEDEDPFDVPRLVDIARSDSDATVRRAAVMSLARFDVPEATSTIVGALNDENRVVRTQAIAALGKVGGSGALALVRRTAARNPDPKVRIAALKTLRAVEREAGRQAEE